jgi:hypothetical protein
LIWQDPHSSHSAPQVDVTVALVVAVAASAGEVVAAVVAAAGDLDDATPFSAWVSG